MGSCDLSDLLPIVKCRVLVLLEIAESEGVKLRVTSTYRTQEEQDELYMQGRGGREGPIVTRASGGHSWHNFRRAADLWPEGNPEPSAAWWRQFGVWARQAGLEWGGDFESFYDPCHVQYTSDRTLHQERELWNEEGDPLARPSDE